MISWLVVRDDEKLVHHEGFYSSNTHTNFWWGQNLGQIGVLNLVYCGGCLIQGFCTANYCQTPNACVCTTTQFYNVFVVTSSMCMERQLIKIFFYSTNGINRPDNKLVNISSM